MNMEDPIRQIIQAPIGMVVRLKFDGDPSIDTARVIGLALLKSGFVEPIILFQGKIYSGEEDLASEFKEFSGFEIEIDKAYS